VLRPLNNALTLLLTALSGVSCVLWARSLRYAEGVEIVWSKGSCLATTHPGEARVCWPSPVIRSPPPDRFHVTASSSLRTDDVSTLSHEQKRRPAFASGTVAVSGTAIRYLQVPFWPLSLACIIWPAAVLLARARRRWLCHSRGLCRVCRYDLRATPQRCPECGTIAQRGSAARRWGLAVAWAAALCCLFLGLRFSARHDFRSADCRPLTIAMLAGYTFDQQHGTLADVPLPIRQLDGQRISIEGYMIPMDPAENMTEFALVQSLSNTGLTGRGVLIQEIIIARVVSGRCIHYFPDSISISGTLHVAVQVEDGYIISIYTIDVDHAEPAPPGAR
jgi:hypothetical protein